MRTDTDDWNRKPVPKKLTNTSSSASPKSMGILVRLPSGRSLRNVTSSTRNPSARTMRKVAAAAPIPLELAEKIPGPTAATCASTLALSPLALVTVTSAGPGAMLGGARKFNCPGATNCNWAGRSAPSESVTVTWVPSREVGRGVLEATTSVPASSSPNRDTQDSGAIGPLMKLAPLTSPPWAMIGGAP